TAGLAVGGTDVTEETWRRVVSNDTRTNAEISKVKPVVLTQEDNAVGEELRRRVRNDPVQRFFPQPIELRGIWASEYCMIRSECTSSSRLLKNGSAEEKKETRSAAATRSSRMRTRSSAATNVFDSPNAIVIALQG